MKSLPAVIRAALPELLTGGPSLATRLAVRESLKSYSAADPNGAARLLETLQQIKRDADQATTRDEAKALLARLMQALDERPASRVGSAARTEPGC